MLTRKHLIPAAAALAALAAAIALPAASGQAGPEPAHCEVVATRSGGMVTLEGVVHAQTALSGSYSFRVASSGGGSSNISQGGGFTASPGEQVKLGSVMLGGSGNHEARLDVETAAGRFVCSGGTGVL